MAKDKGPSLLSGTLAGVFSNLKTTFFDYLADFADFVITFIRLFQVGKNITDNHTNSDGQSKKDSFGHEMYHDGNPKHGLTPVGYGAFSFIPFAFFIGFLRRAYQLYRERKASRYSHLYERVNELLNESITDKDRTEELSTADMIQKLNSSLKNKIEGGKKYSINETNETQISLQFDRPIEAQQNPNPPPQGGQPASGIAEVKNQLSPEFKPNPVLNGIYNFTESKFSQYFKKFWDFANQSSFVFWVGWFPLMLIVGITALSTLPILAAISLIPVGIFATLTAGRWIASKIKAKLKSKSPSNAQPEVEDSESKIIIGKLKQRYVAKKVHHEIMKTLNNIFSAEDAWQTKSTEIKNAQKVNKAHLSISPIKDVLDSNLGKHLLGSKAEQRLRFGVTLTKEVLLGYACTAFVLWLLSTILFSFVGLPFLPSIVAGALVASSGIIGGGLMTAIASSVVGVFFGVKSAAKQHIEDLKYQEKVCQKLSAPYKPGKVGGEKVTKLEKFNHLEGLVNADKRAIETLRRQLLSNGYTFDQNNANKKFLFDYDLNKGHVYNDYYFEKQAYKPSAWTYIKKGMNRAYEFLGGGQTWVFVVRSLFLAGCVGAGLVAGAAVGGMAAFFVIAGVFAVVGGCVRLAQYQLDRRQKHREFFLNTIDEKISHLKKEHKVSSHLRSMLEREEKEFLNPRLTDNVPSGDRGNQKERSFDAETRAETRGVKEGVPGLHQIPSGQRAWSLGSAMNPLSKPPVDPLPQDEGQLSHFHMD